MHRPSQGELAVVGYRAGAALAQRVPAPIGRSVAGGLARVARRFGTERRLIVERNLRRALGDDLDPERLARLVDETFTSYGRYYHDAFRLPAMSIDAVDAGFEVDGLEHLEAAMAAGPPGPVLALPHLGGWEWAGMWIARVRGWGITAVVEPLGGELYDFFLELRRDLGMNIVPLGPDVLTEVSGAARRGDAVCLLSDRDLPGTGVEVEFFGETTTLPAGPAMLGLRLGCPVLPTAVYFKEGDGVHGVVCPPLDTTRVPGIGLRENLQRVTQDLAHSLERLISAAPQQWHLMQPNWPSDLAALAGTTCPTSA